MRGTGRREYMVLRMVEEQVYSYKINARRLKVGRAVYVYEKNVKNGDV